MKIPRSGRVASLLASTFLLGLAGCSDGTGVSGKLSSDEAAALAAILVGQGMESGLDVSGGPAQSPASNPAAAPFTISSQIDAEVPCPLGGTVVVSGSVEGSGDDETGDFDLALTLAQAHRGCRATHEDTGVVFTLDGDPNVRFQFEMSVRNETDFDFLGSMAGRVIWETDDGRSGSCGIDLSFDLGGSALNGTGSANVTGQVCGVELSQAVSVG